MATTETEIAQFRSLPQSVRDTALAYRAKAIADAESAGVSVEDEIRSLIESTVTLESEALRHVQSDFTSEDGRAYWESEAQRLFAQRIALAMDVVDPDAAEVAPLSVDYITISHEGRVITLEYTRAPEPDEEMDARRWREVKDQYTALALEQIAKHGRPVEVYASAPDCQDWMIDQIRPAEERDDAAAMARADYDI